MRKPRELYQNAEYHVTARINRGEFIFESDVLKTLFLLVVKRAKKKYDFRLRNFSIMSNHIHFLIKPGEKGNLSQIMQWILSVFAIQYNKKFGLKGHVWYDRFKSIVIRSYRQFLATFKYIAHNPMKAALAEDPEEYEFGGLWFIRNRKFEFLDQPDSRLKVFLPEFFRQIMVVK